MQHHSVSVLLGVERHCQISLLHRMMFNHYREAEFSASQLIKTFCTNSLELEGRQKTIRLLHKNPVLKEKLYALVTQMTDWKNFLSDYYSGDGLTVYNRMETVLKLLVDLQNELAHFKNLSFFLNKFSKFMSDLSLVSLFDSFIPSGPNWWRMRRSFTVSILGSILGNP